MSLRSKRRSVIFSEGGTWYAGSRGTRSSIRRGRGTGPATRMPSAHSSGDRDALKSDWGVSFGWVLSTNSGHFLLGHAGSRSERRGDCLTWVLRGNSVISQRRIGWKDLSDHIVAAESELIWWKRGGRDSLRLCGRKETFVGAERTTRLWTGCPRSGNNVEMRRRPDFPGLFSSPQSGKLL